MGQVARLATALLGGVALGAMVVGAANAQSGSSNTQHVTLLERMVIGAGRAKVAIDTPQAVTVVDQKDIDQAQATTTGELFANVPGVTIVGSDRQLGEAFNIRGIGTTENSSDGSRIVITVDGAQKFNEQYRMGSFFSEPELYKQVEVLRGPASSTLYGAGAIGGVVNFTTKDASDFIADGKTGAVRLKETLTDNGLGTVSSAILAHRIDETFEILAAGTWRRSNNVTQANGATLPGSGVDTLSGLLKGTVHIDQEQVLSLSYQRWQSSAKDQAYAQTGTGGQGGLISMGPSKSTLGDLFGIVDREVTDETAVLHYANPDSDNPWVDFNFDLTYSNTQNNQHNHRSAAGVPTAQTGDSVLVDTLYGYKTLALSADNTVEWIGEDFENYFTFGLQASTQDRTAVRPATAQPLPAHPQGTENKLGLFAQDEFTYGRLTLTPGARFDYHWVNATSPGVPAREGGAFSPKLAALYELTDGLSIFGSLAHTERLPTIDELYSISAGTAASPSNPAGSSGKTASLDLRKEHANTVEAGFAVSSDALFGGGTSSLKTTGFYSDITDMIASNATPAAGQPQPAYYGNIGRARIYGLEVEGAYDTEAVFARLAYSYTVGTNLVTDTPLTTVPQNKVVATLGARSAEWDLEYGARLTLAQQGDYVLPTASGGDGAAAAWKRVDVFATWKPTYGPLAGVEAQFGIDNLFDDDYRENLSADRSRGRTFKLSLSKQFDY